MSSHGGLNRLNSPQARCVGDCLAALQESPGGLAAVTAARRLALVVRLALSSAPKKPQRNRSGCEGAAFGVHYCLRFGGAKLTLPTGRFLGPPNGNRERLAPRVEWSGHAGREPIVRPDRYLG